MSAPHVVGLGCRLNIAETERIREMVADGGDLIVVNSCSVTVEAVRQTRRTIRRAHADRPSARILVTGCAAETEHATIAAMPEVHALVPNAAKLLPASYGVSEHPRVSRHGWRTRAFVAIQNGCDHACTFCIIPQGRGASRSRSVDDVAAEGEERMARGAAEIVLTGVDVTAWGSDLPGEPRLGTLILALLERFPALPRLRLSSLDGAEIDPLLFELIAQEHRVMPHLHLSLQHGDDLILKRMKRRHRRADAVNLVERLRLRRPELAVGADVIAGFPTETEAHHAANVSLIRELGVVHGHIFPFSPRHDTPAARMPQVDSSTIRRRAAEVRQAVAETQAEWLMSLVGKPLRVLAEKDGRGYAENYARVATPGIEPGTITTITPTCIEDTLLQ